MRKETLGEYLRYQIKNYNRSILHFSLDIGISETTVHSYLKNKTEPNLDTIAIMAEYWAEKSGKPPSFFIFEMVMSQKTVSQVIRVYQRKQRKLK